jgi:NADH:ubiquinone oxidoreductase subunit F (NADH-binding)
VTSLDDETRATHAIPEQPSRETPPRAAALGGRSRLLLGDVRIPRTGPADPTDRDAWLLRESWDDHRTQLAARPAGGLWLVDVLEAAELAGCGGGFFPTARKWRAALTRPRGATVVANASESEPISAKDATLLRQRPHLVLDGLALACETLGAARAVVWLHADDVVTRLVVEDAIFERRRAGLPEHDVEVVTGPDSYVAGESSAIEQALSGGPALPLFRGFGPNARDRADRPATVVHNVETLARAALLAHEAAQVGPGQRPSLATGPAHQSVIVTVLTNADRRVMEVPASATIEQVARVAGCAEIPAAVLLGGFGGVWVSPREVGDVAITEPALRAVGATLGAGIVAPLPAHACGVAETAAIAAYLSDSSARQCGPCLFGLESLASRLDELRLGRVRRSVLRRIADDLQAVSGRGACSHPDGATRLIASALDAFAGDFAAHADGRPCDVARSVYIPVPAVS